MFKKLLAVSGATLLTLASYVAAVELRDDHPDTYTVQRGDTLWDISARFLNEPWLWPEIWQANPQVENPHLIYPGDVLSLAYLGGRSTLVKKQPQIRRDETPINAVPLGDVEAFLKKAHVFDGDEYKDLPYVVGLEESRLRVAEGQVAYVRGGDFAPGQRVAVLRPTIRYAIHPHPATNEPRIRRDDWTMAGGLDPHTSGIEWAYYAASDNGFEVLGWEALEIADGTITRDGDPATLLLAPGGREVKKGDLLIPYDPQPYDLTFYPHAPDRIPANLRLLAITDRFQYGGPRDVIAISGGARDGFENGHVLSIWRPGELVRDEVAHPQPLAAGLRKNKVQLPDEFVGHVMIFRTFDKVSYGLVMDGIRPARLDDVLKLPDRL
ncbi:LysM peptidoglycan-binding domain-containing protein [Chiayiivirga flava]|nr:LysM domain-containing protein [Chiayiivirga flava]